MKNKTELFLVFLAVAVGALLSGAIYAMLSANEVTEQALAENLTPPFGYIGDRVEPNNPNNLLIKYEPISGQLCAGGELQYSITVDVRRVPASATIIGRINEADTGNNTQYIDDLGTRSLSVVATYENIPRAHTLPQDLPTGRYHYVVIAKTQTTRPAGYIVPFEVVDCD